MFPSEFFIANLMAFLVFLSVMLFTLFGGMDLGIGILSPFMSKQDRRLAVSSIHPFWDINETWLLMAVIFLVLGFTMAYGIFISTFYIPTIVFLGFVVMRGCSIELNHKAKGHERVWDWLLFISSFGIVWIFGVFIGNLVNGLNVNGHGVHIGGYAALRNPISLVSGLLSITGFALLGSSWTLVKSSGSLNAFSKKAIRILVRILYLLLIIFVTLIAFKARARESILASECKMVVFFSMLFLGQVVLFGILKALKLGRERVVFALSYVFILSCGIGFASIIYPYIIPYKFTIFRLLRFDLSLIGSGKILIAIIALVVLTIFYFLKNYRVFRGKIVEELHY